MARPAARAGGCNQILPVDWMAISQGASTATNYQLFPGDRIYVAGDCLIAADNWLSKVLAPVERVLSLGFLYGSTRESLRGNGNNGVLVVP